MPEAAGKVVTEVMRLTATDPLFWIAVTVAVYAAAEFVHRHFGGLIYLNPVLWSVVALVLVFIIGRQPLAEYQQATRALSAVLGPATVALAVVTVRHMSAIHDRAGNIFLAVLAGGATGAGVAFLVVYLLGGTRTSMISVSLHSTTMAVSVELSRLAGGIIGLTAVATLTTGLLGALVGPWLLARVGIRDERIVGLALGVGAHALGTARALEISQRAGAFAAVGLALNAVMTTLLVCVLILFMSVRA